MSRGVLGLAFFTIAFVAVVLLFRSSETDTEIAHVGSGGGDDTGVVRASAGGVDEEPVITLASARETVPADGAAVVAPGTYFVVADTLNIRAAPKDGDIVARAHKGDEIRVAAVDGPWAQVVSDDGTKRWAAVEFLSTERPPADFFVSASQLNVRSAPKGGKVLERMDYRVPVKVYDKRGDWARLSPRESAPRWAAAKFLSRSRPPARYYVKADKLNVRAAPKNGKVLDMVKRGETVEVYTVKDGWARLTPPESRDARWAAMDHLSDKK